jgi:Na+/melibiose symporter-like transporter
MTGQRHSSWRVAAFSAPCLPLAAMMLPVTIYLPNYYARDLGVGLAAVGWAFGLVRLFDLWFDPLLGLAMDRTRTGLGRFRPWFMAGAPLAMLSIYMLFMAQPGVTAGYILLWLVLGFMGQSMAQLGHMAWAAQAAPDYAERSRIYGWWQAFTVGGMLLILALPVILKQFAGANDAQGVQGMGWFVILTLPPAMVLALLAMPEPAIRRSPRPLQLGNFLQLFQQPSALRLLAADILLGTGPALAGTLFFFYFDAVHGYPRGQAAQLLLVYFVGALVGAPLWTRLAGRLGKHRALMVAAGAYALAQLSVLVAPEGLGFSILVMFLAGLPFSAGSILLKAMMADVGDEVRLKSGHDQSGLLFSLLTGSIKIGSASAVILSTSILAKAGFDAKAGAANSESALLTLSLIFAVAPAMLALGAILVLRGYRLDAMGHAEVRRQLEERDRLDDLALVMVGGSALHSEGPAPTSQSLPTVVGAPITRPESTT